jgi:hypothetical protein
MTATGPHLLRPAQHRHRPGHATSAMIVRALMGRLRKVMRSADAARPRPDGAAVSPAIGPLPTIVVPASTEGTMSDTPAGAATADKAHARRPQTVAASPEMPEQGPWATKGNVRAAS